MGTIQKKATKNTDLRALVEASTKASGVPVKVQDVATVAKLERLVQLARRARPKAASNSSSP